MKNFRSLALVLGLFTALSLHAATTANQVLQYIYGAPDIEIEKLCWPNDDLWMLRGPNDPAGLAELAEEKIAHGKNEVLWTHIQMGLCMVEIREGKFDATFMLDQIYYRHREIVLQFIYATLTQDRDALDRLTTNAANVKFDKNQPPPGGDLDVYQGIVPLIPVVRVSLPAADKTSKSITYRVPLGPHGFNLRLVKKGGAWKVDTTTRVEVPLEFLFN